MNLKKYSTLALTGLSSGLLALGAQAESDSGVYMHLQLSQDNYEASGPSYNLDAANIKLTPKDSVTGHSIGAGYNWNSYLSFELGYRQFGEMHDRIELNDEAITTINQILGPILPFTIPFDTNLLEFELNDRNQVKGPYAEILLKYPFESASLFFKLGYMDWEADTDKEGIAGGIVVWFLEFQDGREDDLEVPVTGLEAIEDLTFTGKASGGDVYFGVGFDYALSEHLNFTFSVDHYEFGMEYKFSNPYFNDPNINPSQAGPEQLSFINTIEIDSFQVGFTYQFF